MIKFNHSVLNLKPSQKDGIDVIVGTWNELYPDEPIEYLAYILATAWHETAYTMEPVRETLAKTDQQAINRLENAWKSGKLSWVKKPYWRSGFFGRGYVQLTWEYNYKKAGEKLGYDFVSDPSKVMIPRIAAKILIIGSIEGWFTSKKLPDYMNNGVFDSVNARRVINGKDKATKISGHYKDFIKGIEEVIVMESKPELLKPIELPKPTTAKEPQSIVIRILKMIIQLLEKRNTK